MVSTDPHWYAQCLGHMICSWGKLYSQLEQGSLSSQFLRPWLLESLLPSILQQSTQLGVNKQDLCYLFGKPPKPSSSCWTRGIACLYSVLFPSPISPCPAKALIFLLFQRREWVPTMDLVFQKKTKKKKKRGMKLLSGNICFPFSNPKPLGQRNTMVWLLSWNGKGKNTLSSENKDFFLNYKPIK